MKTIMRVVFFICFLLAFHLAFSNGDRFDRMATPQAAQQARPNVPGDLILDFGLSLFNSPIDTMSQSAFRSRAVNIYYLYHIPFGDQSSFSFNPGIGIGIENYNFKGQITLRTDGSQTNVEPIEDVIGELNDITDMRKSKLSASYLDIPLELRFHANKVNHDRGFRAAIGGRIGVLFDAHTKVKYEVDDDRMKKFKLKENFSLNRIRYGVSGRIGIGAFSVFYYQNLSPLFQKDKGPEGIDTQTFMAGISLTLF